MTKKHFEWAALWLAKHYGGDDDLNIAIDLVMEMFAEFGEHFDAHRFISRVQKLVSEKGGAR